jgi:hypothetical protein
MVIMKKNVDSINKREEENSWEEIYRQEEYERSLKTKNFYNRVFKPFLRRLGLGGGIVD